MMAPSISVDDDPPGQPKVLLVDDDEVNLLLTSVALQDQGFTVTQATGGDDLEAQLDAFNGALDAALRAIEKLLEERAQ